MAKTPHDPGPKPAPPQAPVPTAGGYDEAGPGDGAAAPRPDTNGMAIASLVFGIAQIVLCGIGAVLALAFGYIATHQIKHSEAPQRGRGLAIAGIVLGWIGALLVLAVAVWVMAVHTTAPSAPAG